MSTLSDWPWSLRKMTMPLLKSCRLRNNSASRKFISNKLKPIYPEPLPVESSLRKFHVRLRLQSRPIYWARSPRTNSPWPSLWAAHLLAQSMTPLVQVQWGSVAYWALLLHISQPKSRGRPLPISVCWHCSSIRKGHCQKEAKLLLTIQHWVD